MTEDCCEFCNEYVLPGLQCGCPGDKAALERDRYRSALNWALGAGEDFPSRPEGAGAYWWRSELQKRAGLKWDGEKFIPE